MPCPFFVSFRGSNYHTLSLDHHTWLAFINLFIMHIMKKAVFSSLINFKVGSAVCGWNLSWMQQLTDKTHISDGVFCSCDSQHSLLGVKTAMKHLKPPAEFYKHASFFFLQKWDYLKKHAENCFQEQRNNLYSASLMQQHVYLFLQRMLLLNASLDLIVNS